MRAGQKRDAARRLRRDSTDAEKIMWRLLRDRRFNRVKFRRQLPIGPFVVDFAAIEQRLIVEVDGGQHAENAYDIRRQDFLERRGWRMVRFWNNDVLRNREGVWDTIQGALELSTPSSRAR